MKYLKGLIFSLIFLVAAVSAKDIIATTEDGKKVLLQENGSWRYVAEKKESEKSTERISLVEIIKSDPNYDFRKVRWGMGKKEVMVAEDAKLLKNSGTSLEYEVRFLGYNCTVVYDFVNDKLAMAKFIIRQPHVDPALYYKDYDELKKYLTPLYGVIVSDQCDFKNEMYRHDKSKWGFAVSLGFLTCKTVWRNKRTQITLAISGGNHQIATNLEYTTWGNR